ARRRALEPPVGARRAREFSASTMTTAQATIAAVTTRRLERSHAWSTRTLLHVWAYRELLYFLIWRDVKLRYKQTLLGAASALIDFAVAFVLLLALMAWYHIVPGAAIIWVPALLVLAVTTAAAASVWLSALNVRYRDVRYVVPFVIQLWLFATPVAYPASLVPERWRAVYYLNPMAGVIEGFRWALAGGPPPGALTLVSAAVVVVLIAGGSVYFRRVEGT